LVNPNFHSETEACGILSAPKSDVSPVQTAHKTQQLMRKKTILEKLQLQKVIRCKYTLELEAVQFKYQLCHWLPSYLVCELHHSTIAPPPTVDAIVLP